MGTIVRILHVIPYMHPSAGGPPVVVENFARETSKRGHLTEIVSTSSFCDGDERAVLERLNQLVPTFFVPQSRAFLDAPSRRALSERVQTADIVHVHTLWHPLNIMVRRECAYHCRPYVLMPHGMLDPYSLTVKRWRKAFYLRAIERQNIVSARRLIYTTAEEERLAETGLSYLPKGVVIPLGGDVPEGDAASLRSAFFARFPKARGRRQLLFLGRLHLKKGLDRILAILPSIVKTFPDVLLTVVGDGAPDFEAALRNSIAALGMEDSVMMTGRLDGADKWGAYASAELFLLPSRQENFAITVAESMHMGIPVIISSKVNTWPYVTKAGAGLVLDENRIEVALKDAILCLLRDDGTRKSMGQHGLNFARKHLTWAGAATDLLNCYEAVLSELNKPQ